jgi:ABC-type multidrug transport system fused ATPase/permease subunit
MAKGKESVRLSNLVNSRVIDVVTNLKYLKLISSNGKFFNSLKHNINQFSRNLFKIHRNNALLIAPTELFGILSFFLILMLGLYIKINIESIVVVALLFQRVYIKINDFYRNYQNYLIVLPGFTWIMDLKEDLKVHKGINGHVNIDKVPTISFSDVSFSYDKKRDILHSIDIAFDERKMIAIVGPSGSGKTTIVDLLCGFLSPDKGKICIGNQLLSDINRDSYRRLVSYIPQRPFLYNDTIRNNITLGEGRFLDEEIFRVSKLAHVDDFISRLPRKYDELIGDGGVKLSGGERQRIVLARELLKRPQLLILDEATNALDTETEEKIQHTIDNLIGKMTVVVIAHRFTTIKKADVIYVVENGHIVESGKLEQLLECSERFRNLYATEMI